MRQGLTPQQEVIELKVQDNVFTSIQDEITAALAEKPLHRIVSLATTSTQEYNTAQSVLIVIEYLDQ